MRVFEVQHDGTSREFLALADARVYAEATPRASLIHWNAEPNMPGRWPAIVYRSSALWVWEGGAWTGCDIHGGGHSRTSINESEWQRR